MSSTNDSPQPKLPPELEYDIFVQAFEDSRKDALNFILVAKRVHDWLIPHIFNIVIFDPDHEEAYPPKFNLPTYERYGQHVRNLFIGEVDSVVDHLHLFFNVTNLVLWQEFEPSQLESLLTFNNITRLSIAINHSTFPSPFYFTLFSKLTHLDLISTCTTWQLSAIEPHLHLPCLTHLCILGGFSQDVVKLFLDRKRCPRLRVVILWGSRPAWSLVTVVPPRGEWESFPVEDERFLFVLCRETVKDWESGVRGGEDMWVVADRYFAARRDGRL